MSSLEQSDAEEALAEWMEGANIENAWKMAPTLVSIGLKAEDLECARAEFPGSTLSDALNWIEAMASSMQLVGTIEESIGRVSDLVMAVKSYAYEGKGKKQSVDINSSIHATLVILSHKMREKEITVEKDFASDLPPLQSECTGLNQIWTNLLDNSIDAVGPHGKISVKTWAEKSPAAADNQRTDICIRIADDGSGIPLESQAHIFDTFYTTKPVGVGTGLGTGHRASHRGTVWRRHPLLLRSRQHRVHRSPSRTDSTERLIAPLQRLPSYDHLRRQSCRLPRFILPFPWMTWMPRAHFTVGHSAVLKDVVPHSGSTSTSSDTRSSRI